MLPSPDLLSTLRPVAHPLSVLALISAAIGITGCGAGEPDGASSDMDGGWQGVPIETVIENASEPHLAPSEDGVVLSWWRHDDSVGATLEWAEVVDPDAPLEPRAVVSGNDFFVNWADFPSVTALPGGRLVAHWLQRGSQGGYDYGVRVAWSDDEGENWTPAWTPHEDGTPTEHGFVSVQPEEGNAFSLVWLDGRKFVDEGAGGPEMTLRARSVSADGTPSEETLVDGRICDCCQTGSAATSRGPLVVFRDRSEGEIRDIAYSVREESGWTTPAPVAEDGWEIAGCPVNGPQVAADGDLVFVAWFTGADDRPRVHLRVSPDAGRSWGEVHRVDHGNPGGRVDVVPVGDGRALVSWVERIGTEEAEIRVQEVDADGLRGEWLTVATTSAARAAGFPRMAALSEGEVLVAWTDVDGEIPRVRLQRLTRAP